jgi:hypothetical protein
MGGEGVNQGLIKEAEVVIEMHNLKHLTILLLMNHATFFVAKIMDVMLSLAPTPEGQKKGHICLTPKEPHPN